MCQSASVISCFPSCPWSQSDEQHCSGLDMWRGRCGPMRASHVRASLDRVGHKFIRRAIWSPAIATQRTLRGPGSSRMSPPNTHITIPCQGKIKSVPIQITNPLCQRYQDVLLHLVTVCSMQAITSKSLHSSRYASSGVKVAVSWLPIECILHATVHILQGAAAVCTEHTEPCLLECSDGLWASSLLAPSTHRGVLGLIQILIEWGVSWVCSQKSISTVETILYHVFFVTYIFFIRLVI